uniref:RNase H type-1 domain-containing protein n=1 Tax=Fagus sylvatica TaxID=28930 RepID=A0A2N9I2H9_FAGSY
MSMRAMDEPSCPWVLMEVSLKEKRMVSIGNSSARASNKVLRCTSLTRALWFGICGIKTEHFHLASAADLVEVIVFPSDEVVTSGTSSYLSNGNEGWVRPNFGIIKINCDATVGPRFSSIAAVTRDWRGKLVFAFSKKVETILPLQAEAEAIIWTGQLAIAHDLSKVIVEFDCKTCVEAVNRIGSYPWLIKSGMLIFANLMSGLTWWKLCWVSRLANRAPHALAKWSLQYLS